MIEFYECANYRGPLQAKEDGGKFFWRVDCDFEESDWIEIPAHLWEALKKYHEDTAEQRKPLPDDDGDDARKKAATQQSNEGALLFTAAELRALGVCAAEHGVKRRL